MLLLQVDEWGYYHRSVRVKVGTMRGKKRKKKNQPEALATRNLSKRDRISSTGLALRLESDREVKVESVLVSRARRLTIEPELLAIRFLFGLPGSEPKSEADF